MDEQEFIAKKRAIDLALSHIIEKGSDDIFKPPVFSGSLEHAIIVENLEEFKKQASNETLKFLNQADLSRCKIGMVRETLVVRDQFSFRKVAWLDPFDSVKYLASAILVFDDIERSRVPRAKAKLHSHRKSQVEDQLFDENFGYSSFRAASGELARANVGKWMVITDIANFFDRIGNHSLENHLLDIGSPKNYVTLIREILLFWSGDRRSFGLPVGSDASRILSEVIFLDIDRKLDEADISFLRYVDDFRILANTRAEAHAHIEVLTRLLAEEGLTLNGAKTSIFEIREDYGDVEPIAAFIAEEHEVIDLDERKFVKVARTASGRTSYAKYYKKPGQEALRKLKKIDKVNLLSTLNLASGKEVEEGIKLLVKYFVYVDQDIVILKEIIKKRLTSLFYICDALIKESHQFSEEIRAQIVIEIHKLEDWTAMAYPYKVPVLKLFSQPEYRLDHLARKLVDSHAIGDNLVFFREVIALASHSLDRPRVRWLALEAFGTVPPFVQRAIYRAVVDHPSLSNDEKRPLLKNMQQTGDDWFIRKMPARLTD